MSERGRKTHRILHSIDPVFDADSRILVLGTLPSIASRKEGFYYMHPQNLFWKVLAAVLEERFPETAAEKKRLLLGRGIALWDVLKSCEIEGSLDSAIRDPEPNDLGAIFKAARIRAVFVNGRKAESLYRKFHAQAIGMEAIYLPSTSPANRKSYDFDGLCRAWELILQHIQPRRN